jgi:hypothetical protein
VKRRASLKPALLANWQSAIGNHYYPASFRSLPVADFSKHSREQYSESFDPGPIARSAGIHVPQATQRTSLFSVLTEPLRRGLGVAFGESRVPRKMPNTFFTIAM